MDQQHLTAPDLDKSTSKEATGKFYSIRRSLIIWFILLAVIPTTLVAFFIYQKSRETLIQLATEKLQQSSTLTVKFLDNWFEYRLSDLANQAESKRNANLLYELTQGFRGSRLKVAQYVGSADWKQRINYGQSDLAALRERYDYLYDLFLIDIDGNILFSAAQEPDLGTNLRSGPYANTLFAKSVEIVLKNEESNFSDLERYAPSKNVIAGFLAAPVYDDFGTLLGAFAMQLRFDGISNLLKNQENTLLSHYLIGEDGILRTALGQDQSDILVKKTNTFSEPKSHGLNINENQHAGHDSGALIMESKAHAYTGPDGQAVIGLHNAIKLPGKNWILVSEINESDALGLADLLGISTLSIALITAILAAGIAILLARRLTDPLLKLSEITKQVATGRKDVSLDIKSNNEIGQLASAFKHMLDVQKQNAKEIKTSHLATEKALTDLIEQRYVLDQHAIVAITDVKGLITHTNEKFCEISGYSAEELIGQDHRIIKSHFHDDNYWRDMYRTVAAGGVWHGNVCNRAKDGSFYWVDTTIAPFLGEDGKPEAYIAIRTDITRIKQTEEELLIAKEKAEQASLAKSNFLAMMSHEIRTPMNGVIGMLSLLTQTSLDSNQLRKAQVAQSSAESLLNLLNDILDFSKIDAHKLELEEIDFSLHDLFEKFAETMAFKAQEKDLEFVLDITDLELDFVKGDPGRLRQILTNLVGNAIKFTQEGEIVIKAALEKKKDKLHLYCSVRDTGVGIPYSKVGVLFDPFTQVDASTTRNFGGTGLGLAIVDKLCKLMKGGIEVSSQLGRGSNFAFTIELAPGIQNRLIKPTANLSEIRVLIVDDNLVNREVLREQLKYWGCQVEEAESGAQAIELCKRCSLDPKSPERLFDIALLDFLMPEMDGAELGKILRTNPNFDSMKLAMMTSAGSRGDARFFADLKFDAYLPKPVSTSSLIDTLIILTDSGEVLKQASPLVTEHYLKSLLPAEESLSLTNPQIRSEWPKNTSLLIAEDNPVNQEVVAGMLEGMKLSADIAIDGNNVLEILRQSSKAHPYTLILMDCQMPDKDGYEATHQIRNGVAGNDYKDIIIIAMTANAMDGDREKCLAAGMNDYLTKPLLPDTLKKMLSKWLCEKDVSAAPTITKKKTDKQLGTQQEGDVVWNVSQVMVRVDNDVKHLLRLIDLFIENMPHRLEDLRTGVDSKNAESVINTTHTIKGIAANLDGLQVCRIASDMEALAKQNQWNRQFISLVELEAAYMRLYNEFLDFKSEQTQPVIITPVLALKDIDHRLKVISAQIQEGDYIDPDEIELLIQAVLSDKARSLLEQLHREITAFEMDEAQKTIQNLISVIEPVLTD